MRFFDFSSWTAIGQTLVAILLMTVIGMGIRILMMMTLQQRQQRMNRQINERLRTLMAAYKVLGGSFTGPLAVDPRGPRRYREAAAGHVSAAKVPDAAQDLAKEVASVASLQGTEPSAVPVIQAPAAQEARALAEGVAGPKPGTGTHLGAPAETPDAPEQAELGEAPAFSAAMIERRVQMRNAVEAALSDILLLGTEEHVRLAGRAAAELAAGHQIHTAELVVSLRNYIRKALDLEAIPADAVIPAQGPTRPSAQGSGGRGQGREGGADRGEGGGMGGGGMAGGGMGMGGGMGGMGMGMGMGLGRRGDQG